MKNNFRYYKQEIEKISIISRLPNYSDMKKSFNNWRKKVGLQNDEAYFHKNISSNGLPYLRFVLRKDGKEYKFKVMNECSRYVPMSKKFQFIEQNKEVNYKIENNFLFSIMNGKKYREFKIDPEEIDWLKKQKGLEVVC